MRHRRNKKEKEEKVCCENSKLGCKVKVRRSEKEEHAGECLYRFVNCEACGQKVLLKDVYIHQRLKGCYEKKLRQEVVKRLRQLRRDVTTHQSALDHESAHREMQKKKDFRLRLHEKIGYSPRVPSAFSPRSLSRTSSLADSGCSSGTSSQHNSGEFTHSGEKLQRDGKRPLTCTTSEVHLCSRCQKAYRSTANHDTACQWHKGPMLPVFGGCCACCGRLKHQEGCMLGFHVSMTSPSRDTMTGVRPPLNTTRNDLTKALDTDL